MAAAVTLTGLVCCYAGKRYGLTATQNLSVGSLLLVVPALAVAFGPTGAAPSNADLAALLDGQQLDPLQLQWLRLLYRPTTEGQQQQQQQDELQLLQQLLLQGETAAAPATAAAGQQGRQDLSIVSVANPFTSDQIQQIIAENTYSEISEDIGASLLRELDPEGITGLWPEYALLNHSCAPNTVAVVIGRYLILRAVQPVLAGEELTGSYLGKIGFSPVGLRRAYLSGIFGFHCQCPRCMCEQSIFPTVYCPADNVLMGTKDANNASSSSGNSEGAHQQQQASRVLDRVVGFFGLGGKQQQQQQQIAPSQQHMLLLQLHADTEGLAAAVQEAAVADRKRREKQLDLLHDIGEKADLVIHAIEAVHQQIQQVIDRDDRIGSVQQAAKWVLAAVYPLLDLRVQLLELLLSSNDIPVDDRFLLYDDPSTSSSSSNQRMAAVRAAVSGRLSSTKSNKSRKTSVQGFVGSLFSGWGTGADQGPVTKMQLLTSYVESLERCVTVADAMARGSDIHIVTALKYMDAVRHLHGLDSEQTRLAEGLCSRAHAARYGVMKGNEGQQLLARLISARRRQLLGISLARKMSVLAWEDSSGRD